MKQMGRIIMMSLIPALLAAQSGSINNTLGSGGLFIIKDGSTTFLTLGQSDGYLGLAKSISLANTTDATTGVIFKEGEQFLHNYHATGTIAGNTFVGAGAGNFTLSAVTPEGTANTGVGSYSLSSLTTGSSNSGFGLYALFSNTSGLFNAGTGQSALYSNDTASYNSAFGARALFNTQGSYNSALGYRAGANLTSGRNNTLVGNEAQPSSPTVSNEITLGNGDITTLRCQTTTITSLSDARDKKNIQDLPLGLDFVMNLKPRLYNWDRREWYEDGKPDGSKMSDHSTAGFIAQELDEAQRSAKSEWLNLVLKSNPDRLEATPGNLLPVMVKAIQELKAENDRLRKEVAQTRSIIAEQVKQEVRSLLLKGINGQNQRGSVPLSSN